MKEAVLPTIQKMRDYLTDPLGYSPSVAEQYEIGTKLPLIKLEMNEDVLKSSYANIIHAQEFISSLNYQELFECKLKDIDSLPK